MRIVRRGAIAGLSLVLALAAAPAFATLNTYVFTSTGNNTLTSNGGTLCFGSGSTACSSSPAVTATVSAWNVTKANSTTYTLSTAQLGAYSGGLGVTSGAHDQYYSENSSYGCSTAGSCDQHQIDNLGNYYGTNSIDFVQIVFSKAVTLSGIGQTAFAMPTSGSGYSFDDDFSYGGGSSALSSSTTSLSVSQVNAMFGTTIGANGECNDAYSSTYQTNVCSDTRTGLSAGQVASTTWWISAALLNPDSYADGFKLHDFTVVYNVPTAAVPEPASWAMMIAGFGFIGSAMRRRKAAERLAAA